MPKKIAVFISGSGTNLLNLIKWTKNYEIPAVAEIVCVFSDNADAKGLEFARSEEIDVLVNDKKITKVVGSSANMEMLNAVGSDLIKSRKDFDMKTHEMIAVYEPDFIVLAGYMKILSPWFVEKWKNKIINIHPALLPAFKGAKAIEEAFNYGVKYSGVTVHYVDNGVDTGKIIDQMVVERLDNDTLESFKKRIHEAEYELYPRAIKRICSE